MTVSPMNTQSEADEWAPSLERIFWAAERYDSDETGRRAGMTPHYGEVAFGLNLSWHSAFLPPTNGSTKKQDEKKD